MVILVFFRTFHSFHPDQNYKSEMPLLDVQKTTFAYTLYTKQSLKKTLKYVVSAPQLQGRRKVARGKDELLNTYPFHMNLSQV